MFDDDLRRRLLEQYRESPSISQARALAHCHRAEANPTACLVESNVGIAARG